MKEDAECSSSYMNWKLYMIVDSLSLVMMVDPADLTRLGALVKLISSGGHTITKLDCSAADS